MLKVAASPPGFGIGWLLGMLPCSFELVGARLGAQIICKP